MKFKTIKFKLEDCPKNENGHWTCKTTRGYDVVLFTDKAQSLRPLVGEYCTEFGTRFLHAWDVTGQNIDSDMCGNLVSPAKRIKVEFWVNVHEGDRWDVYVTRREADENMNDRIACHHFCKEIGKGEGLE